MNCNPALHTNCEVLKEVIPSTVTETLGKLFESIVNSSKLIKYVVLCIHILNNIYIDSMDTVFDCKIAIV